MSSEGDRNLLFGILALQLDFVSREKLIAACSAWMKDKSHDLPAILVQQGAMDSGLCDLVQELVTRHLQLHHDDPLDSLAALELPDSICEDLIAITDPGRTGTLTMSRVEGGQDDETSTAWAVGETTSTGQRYQVLRFHRRGGLGEVFVAYDRELNREVALKEIQRRFAQCPISQSRFTLEAEVTGGLEHPGIVPVYGLGYYDDGRPYYAMRFIRGENLKTAIAQFYERSATRSPSDKAIEFRSFLQRLLDVCRAIEYAHSRKVLHRDIKPGNIMLGKYGETLVVDWGLASVSELEHQSPRAVEEGPLVPRLSDSGADRTTMGKALGTPAYMSPEQAAGRWDEIGPATDVYGLGATLYVILTGQAPFEGEHTSILEAVCQGEFPPPRRVRPQVPRALEAICLKAMAKRPDQRYASARELAADLERYLADEPVRAYPEPWMQRARRWTRRHRLAVSSVAVLLATSFLALAVGYGLVRHQRDLARQNAAMTREVIDQFLIRIGDDRWSRVPQFEPVRIEMVDRAVALYDQLLKQEPRDASLRSEAAMSLRRAANLYRMINRFDQADALYARSANLLEELVREHPRHQHYRMQWAELRCDQTEAMLRAFGPAAAEPICRKTREIAIAIRQDFPQSGAAQLIEARIQLTHADILYRLGQAMEAIDLAQAAAATFGEMSARWPQDWRFGMSATIANRNLAGIARETGRYELAKTALQRASRLARRTWELDPNDPNLQYNLAAVLAEQGRLSLATGEGLEQAQADFDQAIEMLEALGQQAPDTATYLRGMIEARMARGALHLTNDELSAASEDAQGARKLAEAFQQQSENAADSHQLLGLAWLLEGKVQQKLGRLPQARDSLSHSQDWIDRAQTINPQGPPRVLEAAAELENLRQILD